jgi:hypothetical protein
LNLNNKKKISGAYDDEEAAARAYDLAALKYWGAGTLINFPVSFNFPKLYNWKSGNTLILPST